MENRGKRDNNSSKTSKKQCSFYCSFSFRVIIQMLCEKSFGIDGVLAPGTPYTDVMANVTATTFREFDNKSHHFITISLAHKMITQRAFQKNIQMPRKKPVGNHTVKITVYKNIHALLCAFTNLHICKLKAHCEPTTFVCPHICSLHSLSRSQSNLDEWFPSTRGLLVLILLIIPPLRLITIAILVLLFQRL